MHFFMRVASASSVVEVSEKEKLDKNKVMTKHEIRKNIRTCFIIPPPLQCNKAA